MSLFNSLSLSSMEATAALLLLDSDDTDCIIRDEMQKLRETLKASEDQKNTLKSCAFRIKQEDKDKFLKPKDKRKKIDERKWDHAHASEIKKKKYGYWLTAARTPIFAENFLPEMSINDYKTHFGLSPSQIEKLSKLIKPFYVRNEKQKNLESFVLVGLATLATQKSYREIGIQMSRSKGHVCVWSQKFNSILADYFTYLIKWPKENVDHMESEFKSICGFPGVVGAFGACHIPLKYASKSSDICFKNNKGFYSLVLSATCNYNMRFTSLSIDTPANFQSTNGMSNKTIQALMTNPHSLIQNNMHILAGSGFPLCNQILTPFLKSEESLSKEQRIYNKKLEQTRKIILRSFTLLRRRFQRLYVIDVMDFNRAAASIVAACILHNFVMEDEGFEGSEEQIPLEIEDVLQIDSNDDPLCVKRDEISRSTTDDNSPT